MMFQEEMPSRRPSGVPVGLTGAIDLGWVDNISIAMEQVANASGSPMEATFSFYFSDSMVLVQNFGLRSEGIFSF